MEIATIRQLKEELRTKSPNELTDIILRLAKHKKETKELLNYLVFESDDEQFYIQQVKEELNEHFEKVNESSVYLAKKTIRKVLRLLNRYIRYSGQKTTQIELLLHFCTLMQGLGSSAKRSVVVRNLYRSQVDKIHKAMEKIHEDLKLDYQYELEELEQF